MTERIVDSFAGGGASLGIEMALWFNPAAWAAMPRQGELLKTAE